jgi:integrase
MKQDDLPPGMERHGAQYRIRRTVDGKRQSVHLGADLEQALAEYHRLRGHGDGRLAAIIKRYRRDELPKKAPKTQQEYDRQLGRLERVFGHMHPSEIRQAHAIEYLDRVGSVAANREIALLRALLTKAVHWGHLAANPLLGMRYRNPERGRTRVVEPWEIRYVMRRAPQRLRLVIWIAWLTGLRRGDILGLTLMDCRDDCLSVREGKTGKRVRYQWTRSLERVISRAKTQADRAGRLFPISADGFDSAWQRLRQRLAEDGYDLWQIKDLRAAHASAVEDSGGDASRQLGHSTRSVTARHYLRTGRKVVPIR